MSMTPETADLSEPERRLVEAAGRGRLLDLSEGAEDPAEADLNGRAEWGPDRTVRASVLRDLLLGRHGELDPRGVQLRGGRIVGDLDLTDVTTTTVLWLADCHVPVIWLERAHLPHLCLAGVSTTSVVADGLRIDHDVDLTSLHAAGADPNGVVQLTHACIGGNLNCDGADLSNTDGPALVADGLQVDGGVFLRHGFHAAGFGGFGTVRLLQAHVGGLDCADTRLSNPGGPALAADGLHVSGAVSMHGLRAAGAGPEGVVRMVGAHIGGQLNCHRAEFIGTGGPALIADRLQISGDLFLDGFRATGTGDIGTVRLLGVQVGGQMSCGGAEMSNAGGPALYGDGLQIGGDLFLRDGVRVSGTDQGGAVRLSGARIGGQLSCAEAHLSNTCGPALHADGLQVDSGIFLSGGFRASGTGPSGTVRLPGAQITGQLKCDGAELSNTDGPALAADGLYLSGDLLLRGGFRATGSGELGTVRLPGAQIGGQFSCANTELSNTDGPALAADGLQADSDMILGDGFRATGTGELGTVRLLGAHISGQLVCTGGLVRNSSDGLCLDLRAGRIRRLRLDPKFADLIDLRRLRYDEIPVGLDDWRVRFADCRIDYDPQPYQQLAAAHRDAGHESQARRILIAQQDDLRNRGKVSRGLGVWYRMSRVFLRYGYQSWRALLWLAAILAVAVGVALTAGAQTIAVHPKDAVNPGAHCSVVEQIGLGIDLAVPLINTGSKARCDFDTDQHWGQWLTAGGWLVQLLGWAFATLFIAGFTGIIRKQ